MFISFSKKPLTFIYILIFFSSSSAILDRITQTPLLTNLFGELSNSKNVSKHPVVSTRA